MMRFLIPSLALIAIAACGTTEDNAPLVDPPMPEATLTYNDVKPIFDAKCVGCHGENDPKEGLALHDYASIMKGGEHGAAVVPGDPKASKLVQFIDGTKTPRMPFKQDPLSQEEIDKISSWIAQNATE